MRLFDLHCDTATECYDKNEALTDNTCVVSINKAKRLFDAYAINFTVFSHDNLDADFAYRRAKRVLGYIKSFLGGDAQPKTLDGTLKRTDLSENSEFVLLSLENSLPVCDNIAYVSEFYDLGVRMISPTWNASNPIAGGCYDDCGFTEYGYKFIEECAHLGITVDVSHLGEKGFWQLLERTYGPIIASHSCARALRDHPRNLTDEQIKALSSRGGIVGLNLWKELLNDNGNPDYDDVYAHISHMACLGGESLPAIGSDFDGADMSECLSGPEYLPRLYEYLLSKGFSESFCQKIFFDNAFDYFTKIL